MTDALIKEFLAGFDDSRFPEEFLQQYELLECLAHNDLGETFLVIDRQKGGYGIAKCYSDRSLLSHTRESELLKRLSHAGLPAYIAEYQNDSMCCIVREYAPGISLDQLARQQALSRQQVISIAVQLCEILNYLHGQTPPIIHRDIKPQNIIIDEQGKVTLIDFGISRAYDESAQEDTVNLGTRSYASPEQYGFSQTDRRSDIYSFGVLLCWLLTGNSDVQHASKAIRNVGLARVVARCTAFAPKDRYKSAAQVRDALIGRTQRRWTAAFFTLLAVLLATAFSLNKAGMLPQLQPTGVAFKEPLIEQAVRLTLNKEANQPVTEQDLLTISEIYVFGDQAAGDAEDFEKYANSFVNNDGSVQRGSIRTLEDLAKLKNLRRISLCYQEITDLDPIADLNYLEIIDFRHNPIEDVSALSGLSGLSSLVLFDTQVSDLTALSSCYQLTNVDTGYTLVRSMAAFEGLKSVRALMLRKAPLQSLEGIDGLPLLERIYLSETQVTDLSPLLDLPRLQVVEVDESMRSAAEAIEDRGRFTVLYP
jgi:serine/threonine protein kinase